ncbi:hypothetical protein JIG36_41650 [Actinoplanes sp. LDG1-06]|uniref:Response regulator n=1 Tax=Paractinoplanes ovalisporus TaxID=2810368 RepID=A0ABS2ARP9_9ACTN|nr:hypothetical protein [Actinoplanes ovalisporus]MBM2622028.1 hypothetical protein [Actinoplanes ovalisporus]
MALTVGNTLVLSLLALVAMALIATVLFRGQTFASVMVRPRDTASAIKAVQRAARKRGEPEPPVAGLAPREHTTLARVLWLDDEPDNNLYETVALEQLGRFVTKTTTVDAALHYLGELDFELVITGRNGVGLIKRMRGAGLTQPVVVYTTNASQLTVLGAQAVIDHPHELVKAVNAQLS